MTVDSSVPAHISLLVFAERSHHPVVGLGTDFLDESSLAAAPTPALCYSAPVNAEPEETSVPRSYLPLDQNLPSDVGILIFFSFFIVCVWVFYLTHVFVPYMCLMPTETRRGLLS